MYKRQAYTYVGLVLFLTGANVGFMPAGNYLGQVLTGQSYHWVIIPIGMLIGYFIVKAEPAVYVLNKQVEEVTDGAISAPVSYTHLRPIRRSSFLPCQTLCRVASTVRQWASVS